MLLAGISRHLDHFESALIPAFSLVCIQLIIASIDFIWFYCSLHIADYWIGVTRLDLIAGTSLERFCYMLVLLLVLLRSHSLVVNASTTNLLLVYRCFLPIAFCRILTSATTRSAHSLYVVLPSAGIFIHVLAVTAGCFFST